LPLVGANFHAEHKKKTRKAAEAKNKVKIKAIFRFVPRHGSLENTPFVAHKLARNEFFREAQYCLKAIEYVILEFLSYEII